MKALYLLGLTDNPAPYSRTASALRLPAAFPLESLPELKSYADYLIYKNRK